MQSFREHYRMLFKTLGYPLTASSGTPPQQIAAAEKRLGVPVPPALRDYYLVAGRERRFNRCLNRLLAPTQWSVDKQHLLFMKENQSVLWWGVSVQNPKTRDPAVYQGFNDEPIAWYREHRRCSVFLSAILHYHAVNGGLPHCGHAYAPEKSDYRFEKARWISHGEVGSAKAFSRVHQAVCLTPPAEMSFEDRWSIWAGARTKALLASLGEELGVVFK